MGIERLSWHAHPVARNPTERLAQLVRRRLVLRNVDKKVDKCFEGDRAVVLRELIVNGNQVIVLI